jgi:hypothetical protein
MARHYSTRDFFRQMPNALLALPEAQRNTMDAEWARLLLVSFLLNLVHSIHR